MTTLEPFNVTDMAGKILFRIPIEIFRTIRVPGPSGELRESDAVRELYAQLYQMGYPVSMEEHATEFCVEFPKGQDVLPFRDVVLAYVD